MPKYLSAFLKIIFSLFRFSLMKLFHWNHFHFSLLNIVSPFTEITLEKGAKLTLGKPARIKSGVKLHVRKGAELSIGDNTFLNHNCMILCRQKISIGNDVQLGPQVFIYDHDHDYSVGLKKEQYRCSPVEIGNNVWIGANTVILRGSKIGDNCVVGAGSVIKGEYADNTLVVQKRITSVSKIKEQVDEPVKKPVKEPVKEPDKEPVNQPNNKQEKTNKFAGNQAVKDQVDCSLKDTIQY